jgi:hypothetical protein
MNYETAGRNSNQSEETENRKDKEVSRGEENTFLTA